MIRAGIVGLGNAWETRYAPALERLGSRLGVQAVFDPVADRATQVAAELGAQARDGILALVGDARLDAVLVLDPGWQGLAAVRLAASAKKPVYVARLPLEDAEALRSLHRFVQQQARMLMPELGRRYVPASGRLQELIATHLGPPAEVTVECALEKPFDGRREGRLLALLDWCCYVVRGRPVTVQTRDTDGNRTVRIEFPPTDAVGPRFVELRIRPAEPAKSDQRISVRCAHGTATLSGPRDIAWEAGGESRTESLTDERDEVSVTLDQFCRRVVGGLVPVADLHDVCRSLLLLEAASTSSRTGRPVALNGRW